MTVCACGVELDPHNLTRMCLECKHIWRDRRRGFTASEVSIEEARANFQAVFSGLWRPAAHVSTVYGDTCRCGRFRARLDTARCEWCSRPWRPRPAGNGKRTRARQRSAAKAATSSVPGEVPGDVPCVARLEILSNSESWPGAKEYAPRGIDPSEPGKEPTDAVRGVK